MDRFVWLDAQKGWIRSWHGCLICTACKEERFTLCDKIKWVFQGFASFHVNLRVPSDSNSTARAGPCSPEAAHLFFATHTTLSDPAQLALRIGVLMEQSEEMQGISISDISGREKLVFTFDNSNPYIFQPQQVENISFWQQESSCFACPGQEVTRKEGSRKTQVCACQQVPSHVTVNLQHVALNIYSDEQFNERLWNTLPLPQIMEMLDKILREQKLKPMMDINNTETRAETSCVEREQLPTEAKDVLNHSHILLQKYLNDIDCISECAMKAVEICSGDPRWMGRMLFIMAQHSAHQSLNLNQLQTLKGLLNTQLEECLEKEKLEIEKAWGANSCQFIQQQEMQCLVTSALEHLKEQRKCIEEALLWVELLFAGLNL